MRNKILKGITYVAGVICIAGLGIDECNSFIPYIVLLVCYAWIGLFCYANREALYKDE